MALASSQPLWALWEFNTDPAWTRITMEFTGLATGNESFQGDIAGTPNCRGRTAGSNCPDPDRYGAARRLPARGAASAADQRVPGAGDGAAPGVALGHAQTRELVERNLRELEGIGARRGLISLAPREPRSYREEEPCERILTILGGRV